MATMFQLAVLKTMSGPLHQEGQVPIQELPTAPAAIRTTYDLHLWETSTVVNQVQVLDITLFRPSGTLMTLCGTHRGLYLGAHAVIVVDHGSLPH